MNGYECSRAWYDFAYNNPKVIRPIHHAIIHWIFEKANESNWSEEFQLPTVESCAILGITDRDSYQKALKQLIEFGAVKITHESQGRYIARWVTLEKCQIYLPKKQVSKGVSSRVSKGVGNGVSTQVSKGVGTTPNINLEKPKETLETLKTLETDDDAVRVAVEEVSFDESEEKGIPPQKVASKSSPTLHATMKEIIESLNEGYYWQVKDAKALKSLITKIKFRWKSKHNTEASDENVIESFKWVLGNMPEWYRNKWDTCTIESKFESIVKQIIDDHKNGKSANSNQNSGIPGVSNRLATAWELLAQSRKASQTRNGSD